MELSLLILISSLWFYALMTGLSASVMRSSTMFTFIIVGDKLLNRKVSIYNTLAVSAIVLLIINPYMIYQVGFQLSFSRYIKDLDVKFTNSFISITPLLKKYGRLLVFRLLHKLLRFP